MAIPDFQSVMLPLVKVLGDGQERTMREVTDLLAETFQLRDEEQQELIQPDDEPFSWHVSHT